jgi:hypothetical protein
VIVGITTGPHGKHEDVRNRGPVCAHCLRRCGTLEGGMARIAGVAVCSKPAGDRPDCYRMVMVKFHRLRDCALCQDRDAQQ